MSLAKRLKAIDDSLSAGAPEAAAKIHGFIDELTRSGLAERALKVGDVAPDFSLQATNGRQVSLEELVAHGPVVLAFYRGRWCPYCNAELEALNRAYETIRTAGSDLVAISPQVAQHSREFKEERKLGFEVLSDPGAEVAEAYGLTWTFPDHFRELHLGFGIDLAEYNGDDTWRVPMPARFVVDHEKVIRYAEADPDYISRPEPAHTVEFLRELTG